MTKQIVNEQPVQTVAQTRKKNYAIEFWRFFFAVAICGYHIGTIYAKTIGIAATSIMAGAGEILFVFTLTAGYFLVKHFKRLQANPEYSARSATGRAAEYIWDRMKALLPVLALGIVLGVVSTTIFRGYEWNVALLSVVNGLWEFLGLYSAGYNAALGQANGAMWFISGLLICSYFLYWILCKREDLLAGFIAPFLFVFCGGWWAYTGTRAAQGGWSTYGAQLGSGTGTTGNGATSAALGFNNGLMFVVVGMCGGVILYYVIDYLKKKNFGVGAKVALTILYVVVATVLVVYTVNPMLVAGEYRISGTNVIPATHSFYRWTAHLLCMLLVGLTLLEKDYITQLLNNRFTAKIFGFLGGMALYVYMIHCPFIFLYSHWRGINAATLSAGAVAPFTFAEVYGVVMAIAIGLGVVIKFLMDKFVLKKYPSKKKAVAAEAPVAEVAAPVEEVKAEPVKKAPAKKPAAKTAAKAPAKKVEAPKAPAKKAPAKKAEPAKAPAKTVAKKPATKTTKKSK